MDLGLKGRRVLITGGSKGIGRHCAEIFAAEGAHVAICARDAEGVAAAVKALKAKGVNAFGLRLRHEVFDRWLREGATIDHVLDHLSEVDFDPELCRRFHREIRASFASWTA